MQFIRTGEYTSRQETDLQSNLTHQVEDRIVADSRDAVHEHHTTTLSTHQAAGAITPGYGNTIIDGQASVILGNVYGDVHYHVPQLYPAAQGSSNHTSCHGHVPELKPDGLKSPIWLVPFQQQDGLVGRSLELERLEKSIFQQNKFGRVAIAGLGGIGKSRLALEIAYRTKESRPSCSVFWVQGTDPLSFERDYFQIGHAFDVPTTTATQADVLALVKHQLGSESAGEWLLILDNVDDEDLWVSRQPASSKSKPPLMDYIPRNTKGAVLITTRSYFIASRIAPKDVLRLGNLSDQDALAMLKSRLIHSDMIVQSQAGIDLVQRLTCLPLALVQAAAFINENDLHDMHQYLNLWNETEEGIIELLSESFEVENRYSGIENPLAQTWFISFDHIERSHPQAANYLAFMSSINPRRIPHSLLPIPISALQAIKAIGTLTGYAFIQKYYDNDGETVYDMHQLVHLAIRDWLRGMESLTEWMKIALGRLCEVFPEKLNHANRPVWTRYLPHAQFICASPEVARERTRRDVLKKVAICFYVDGDYAKAVECFQSVLSWDKEYLGLDDRETPMSYANLGNALYGCDRITEAESSYQRALDGFSKLFGKEDSATLKCMRDLSALYIDLRRLLDAEKLLLRAMETSNRVLDEGHAIMSSLANVYFHQGRYKEAEQLNMQVLKTKEKTLGGEHPEMLKILNNLALIYDGQGRLQEAENLALSVIEKKRRVFGEEHPDTLNTMRNLAATYSKQQRWQQVEALRMQTLDAQNGHWEKDSLTHCFR